MKSPVRQREKDKKDKNKISTSASAEENEISVVESIFEVVKDNAEDLLSGTLVVTLNPLCLNYLANRLANFEKGLLPYSTTVKEHFQKIQRLDKFFRELSSLKIESQQKNSLDRTPFNLSIFVALRTLELDSIKPRLITDLERLAKNLESIKISNSLNALEEFFLIEDVPPEWPNLLDINFQENSIPCISNCVDLSKNIRSLNLSNNLISSVANLNQCWKLEVLKMSRNFIKEVDGVHLMLGAIKHLELASNKIQMTGDICKLYSLEYLDLSDNLISTFQEVERLCVLPMLEKLFLKGNPVASMKQNFRLEVTMAFHKNNKSWIQLDGVVPSSSDQRLVESHQIEQTKFVAKNPSPIVKRKKKAKKKRIVSIKDVEPEGKDTTVILEADNKIELQAQVERLYEQAGVRWLRLLNEVQPFSEEISRVLLEKTRQEEAAKAAEAWKLLSPFTSLPSISPTPPAPQPWVPTAPSPRGEKSEITTASSAVENRPLSPRHRALPAMPEHNEDDDSDSDRKEENILFVTKKRDTERGVVWEPRLLHVAKKFIKDYEPTASLHTRYDMKDVTGIEELPVLEGEKPMVSISFLLGGVNVKCLYRMENEANKNFILSNVRESITALHRIKQMKCIQCSHSFSNPSNIAVDICPKCKNSSVVEITSEPTLPSPIPTSFFPASVLSVPLSSSPSSSEPEPKPLKKSHDPVVITASGSNIKNSATTKVEDQEMFEREDELTPNVQLALNLVYNKVDYSLPESSREIFKFFFKSDLIKHNPSSPKAYESSEVWVLLTNQTFYILDKSQKLQFVPVITLKLEELKVLAAGLYHQWFRLDTTKGAFTFLTREHQKTHFFMRALKRELRGKPAGDEKCSFISLAKITVNTFCSAIGNQPGNVEMYTPLFFTKKSKKLFANTEKNVLRTLIVQGENMYLVKEKLFYAASAVGTVEIEYSHVQSDVIHNIVSIQTTSGNGFVIKMEEDNNGKGNKLWPLVAASSSQRYQVISTLSSMWRNFTKLDLPVS